MAFDATTDRRRMVGVDAACAAVAAVSAPLGPELVPLEAAHGRVLAAPVIARHSAPAFPVSAMDGYAVRDADLLDCPTTLRVAGQSFAGDAQPAGLIEPRSCVRIFTGAPMPAGADRVVVQEVVERSGDQALIRERLGGARHVRAAGADFVAGESLLPAGARLTAQALVAAAGADMAELSVFRQARVAVLGTGSELAAPGTASSRPGAVPESVSFGVAAMARDWGAEVVSRRRVGDDLALLVRAAEEALDEADVVVVTGGASVGERDYAKAMFEPFGLEFVFCKVAMKPGKPVWVGRVCGKVVVGLPGNPSAALVTARLFLAPILLGLGGRDPATAWAWRRTPLAAPLTGCGERETFHRAASSPHGAIPIASQDSSAQKALATADLLLRRRSGDADLAVGDMVDALPF